MAAPQPSGAGSSTHLSPIQVPSAMDALSQPGGSDLTDPNGLATSRRFPPAFGPIDPSLPLDAVAHDARSNHSSARSHSRSRSRSPGRSGTEAEDSDDEEQDQLHVNWQPVEEDKSKPCEDELAYIQSKEERSALDYAYWEKLTFFDVDDPEVTPAAQGRIDWLVDRFNGTRERPNKERIMRSPIVRIGGYDFRIKFFPCGNESEFLSIYVECITMQSPDFEEYEDFEDPPFPALAGSTEAEYRSLGRSDVFETSGHKRKSPMKKRCSMAAQVSVVMYNPAEPRVHYHKADAHQFSKRLPDYGWRYFSQEPRHDFPIRRHGQRQAILRNDKLAFSAYIRIVDDPTGCMWEHSNARMYDNSIATTGLRPFTGQESPIAAFLPLLHFPPFRELLKHCTNTTGIVYGLQVLMLKLFTRRKSKTYGYRANRDKCNPVDFLRILAKQLSQQCNAKLVTALIGDLNAHQHAVAGNRLKTKGCDTVQEAINRHPTKLATPQLLTMELERQEYDRGTRRWNKLMNKVYIENRIEVSACRYTLLALITHCGDLQSNRYNCYVRPGGPQTNWYAYLDGRVTAMTHRQAVTDHCGYDEIEMAKKAVQEQRFASPLDKNGHVQNDDEVAFVVMYARDDMLPHAFQLRKEDEWDVPESMKLNKDPPPFVDAAYDATESDLPLRTERECHGRALEAMAEGSGTPDCVSMDGEDVIMSDVDDDSSQSHEAPVSAPTAASQQISSSSTSKVSLRLMERDVLGDDYYHGEVCANAWPMAPHGKGWLVTMSGDEYVGHFRYGKKDGYGKMIHALTGNIYEGEWQDDQQHGQGKLTEAITGNVYEGGWKDGNKHGPFVLKGNITEEDKRSCSVCEDKEMTTAFYDCGHVVACKECAEKIDTCPVCRKRVLARLQLFYTR